MRWVATIAVSLAAAIPVTGPPTPAGMQAWDAAAEQLMTKYGLPGASLTVGYQGRVIFEHGYGYADTKTQALVQPDSAFRLGSVSKSITATVVGLLIQKHKLSLSTRPFATILNKLRGPHNAKPVDRRLKQITIHELLLHKAGWDIGKLGFDPVLDAVAEEHALGLDSPPTCEQAIRYMLSKRLSFKPGTKKAYSNFGYCVLADTIAHVTKMPYDKAVKKLLLDPLGMTSTELSAAKLTTRRRNEVHYYGQGPEARGSQSPYKLSLAASTGAAEWVSTGADLQRFLMVTSAAIPGTTPFPNWSGDLVGVSPVPAQPGLVWEFDGSVPGTSTAISVSGPTTWVFLSNSRPGNGTAPDFSVFYKLALQQSSWPSGNLLIPPAK